MYKQIIKKKKKEMEDMAPEGKPLHIGKKMMMHAMESMAPEMEEGGEESEDEGEMEDEKEMPMKKGVLPEAKIEIELMLNGAKKKKKS